MGYQWDLKKLISTARNTGSTLRMLLVFLRMNGR